MGVFHYVLVIILLLILIAMAVLIVRFYVKIPPNLALIRSGFGGKKVVIYGGIIVVPFLHEIKWISLETVKLRVYKSNKDGVITKDRFRMDIGTDFYMRVEANEQDVETAFRSVGEKSLSAESLRAIMEEKLVSATRAIAAKKTLNELHENRIQFAKDIKDSLRETLHFNGFTLEDVSVHYLDQTKKDQLDPDNVFDAEGLKQITDQTSQRVRERNEIERNTEVSVKQKDVESEKLKLKLEQEQEFAAAEQKKDIEIYKTEKQSETEKFKFQQETAIRTREIEKDRDIDASEIDKSTYIIEKEREKEEKNIEKDLLLDIARLEREMKVIQKEKEKINQENERSEAEALKRKAIQNVITVEKEAETERQRKIASIDAQKEVEVAELKARVAELNALIITREGNARAEVEQRHREAENTIDKKLIVKNIAEEIIENLPVIIKEMMEPARNIDSIKVLNIGGNSPYSSQTEPNVVGSVLSSIFSSTALLPVIREIIKFSNLDEEKIMSKIKEEMHDIEKDIGEDEHQQEQQKGQ